MMTGDEDHTFPTADEALGQIRAVLTQFDHSVGHSGPKVDQTVPRVDPPRVGSRIRAARRVLGVSVASFAERLGLSAKTLHRYEGGTRAPDADVLAAICGECRVTADWLLFGRGEGPSTATPTNEGAAAAGTGG